PPTAPAPPPKKDSTITNPATWFCIESHASKAGACKPRPDQCEATRTTLKQSFSDIGPCYGALKASCFRIGNDLHCAPTAEICDWWREVAGKRGKVTACRWQHDANEPAPVEPPPPPPKPKGPQWSCTESKSKPLGTCKPQRAECDGFRSAMLARVP